MKKSKLTLVFIFLILASNLVNGQEIAVTERGDSVVLYSNGRWDYYSNYSSDQPDEPEIKMNDKTFSTPKSSNKKINGSNQAYQIWYSDKKWKRLPVGELNPEADVALELINGDAYAMIIYEEVEIPPVNLSQIALDNAISVSSNMKMVDREFRVVNNDTIVWMRMDGTVQGMKVSYYSYYFSNPNGSVQFHTFTGQSLVDKYKEEMESLLNGFVMKE